AHSQPAAEGSGVNKTEPGSASQPLAYGYNGHTQIQGEAHIHPELRSSHEPPATVPGYAPIPTLIQPGVPIADQGVAMSGPTAPVAPPVGAVQTPESVADGRKAKRELSQSKRAAQNRAAQRAFRQRKEGYIKKLEQQVREYGEMEVSYKALQSENYLLREYVAGLQSRLLETQGQYPPPPPGLEFTQQPPPARPDSGASTAQAAGAGAPTAPVSTPLEVAAQAVAGLNRGEHLAARNPYAPQVRADDDATTAEAITRQLQAEGGPDGLPAVPDGLPAAPM
ncbi:putative transcription factor kapC, partial [Achaetomium macrosporum]